MYTKLYSIKPFIPKHFSNDDKYFKIILCLFVEKGMENTVIVWFLDVIFWLTYNNHHKN